ncbi:MAG: hypothetical protein EXR85_09725 [Xanthomonadales bacterium]|nr:hypothetical protein [Xanthomonadales bacterium]
MKQIQAAFNLLAVMAFLALVAGCASVKLQDNENLAVAAGFKVITPTQPDQITLLKQLPAGKVTLITHEGKTYYVLPDVKNNVAYVGGPKQYQAFQQIRLENKISNENLEAAQTNEMNEMEWNRWGGWGGWGPAGPGMGWY